MTTTHSNHAGACRSLRDRIATACLAWVSLVCAAGAPHLFAQSAPPPLINYQGVLRDASDLPLTGSYDMTLRLFSDETGGAEILVDDHSGPQAVPVVGGLFSTQLGGGTVSDGSGHGLYLSLDKVFRSHATVYLQVEVGGEVLLPRTRIVASAYAHNASLAQDAAALGGRAPSTYLDTTSDTQVKDGALEIRSFDTGTVQTLNLIRGAGATPTSALHAMQADLSVQADLAFDGGTDARAGIYARAGSGSKSGLFQNYSSGTLAALATPQYGIEASGNDTVAFLRSYAGYGLIARGTVGGLFQTNTATGQATVGSGHYGISSGGSASYGGGGGQFYDVVGTGIAFPGHGNTGIDAYGTYAGGIFRYGSPSSYSTEAYLAYGSATIQGNGSKNFVQNDPTDPSRVIVYSALEGDEAATYTRGSARLAGEEVRVPLGPTFRLVTNPEIGLTAHVTSRSGFTDLYVASVSTEELVVRRGAARRDDAVVGRGAPVDFDYIVYGLRAGFENVPVVQERRLDAPIPSMAPHDAQIARHPEFAASTPRARFAAITTALGRAPAGEGGVTPGAAARLVAAIGTSAPVAGSLAPSDRSAAAPTIEPALAGASRDADVPSGPSPDASGAGRGAGAVVTDAVATSVVAPTARPALAPSLPMIDVAETVEAGDLLAVTESGAIVRSFRAADRLVVGIVGGARGERFAGRAPLAPAGSIVVCRVDASAGPIALGDLLAASALPGFATAAQREDGAVAGTIVAKALEPLAAGNGLIRVLVMPR